MVVSRRQEDIYEIRLLPLRLEIGVTHPQRQGKIGPKFDLVLAEGFKVIPAVFADDGLVELIVPKGSADEEISHRITGILATEKELSIRQIPTAGPGNIFILSFERKLDAEPDCVPASQPCIGALKGLGERGVVEGPREDDRGISLAEEETRDSILVVPGEQLRDVQP